MQNLKDQRQSHLADQLGHFSLQDDQFNPEEEGSTARHLAVMRELLHSCPRALSRLSYEPGHFTASAIVLCPHRRNILLIRHKKLQLWLQPGGHIEDTDRDICAAAQRELIEETALSEFELQRDIYDVDVHQIPAIKNSPAHLHHDIRVLFFARSTEVVGSDEVEDARWFPLEEVAHHEGPLWEGIRTDKSVIRLARRLQGSESYSR